MKRGHYALLSRSAHPVLFSVVAVVGAMAGPLSAQQVTGTPVEVSVPWAPVPVSALGLTHLVYELHLTNFGAEPLLVHGLTTAAGEDPGNVVRSATPLEVARSAIYPGASSPGSDTLRLEPGQRTVLLQWVTLRAGQATPATLIHYLALAPPGDESVDTLEATRIALHPPIGDAIESPVGPGKWVAIRGPSNTSGHRTSLVTLHGKVRVPQRFAVDWTELGGDGRLYSGDPTRNENWYGYGETVRSATSGTVVLTRDEIPENVPLTSSMEVVIDATMATGNTVVVRDPVGRYITYAHLQPGSLAVRVGDAVRPGDTVGRIGNSGNSLAPHLHFQIGDAADPLAGEGLPFRMRSFRLLGRIDSLADALRGAPWQPDGARPARDVEAEQPLENMVVEIGPE